MISRKQTEALSTVYKRRIEVATKALRASMAELNEAIAVVQKHEQTVNSLQVKIDSENSQEITQSITEVVQRGRLLYWLRYDLEDIQFRLKNAQESLNEKQSVYDEHKKVYLKAKQRLDFIHLQKRKKIMHAVEKQEQSDEELFNDILTGHINA